MSSITELQQELIGDYINQSSNALFLFDCMITLSQEVNAIWSRKWTATTWLYVLTRYGLVIDVIVLPIPPWSSMSCAVIQYIGGAFQLLQFLCLAWFSALRVYAVLDGQFLLAGTVLLLNLVPFATNMFYIVTTVVIDDAVVCTLVPGISDNLLLSLSLTTRISVIFGDTLVLAVTWTKSGQAYREARQLNIRAPLATILFRDGTIYFLILLMVNVLQMVAENVSVLSIVASIAPFFNTLPPMIVCHFILSLRQIQPVGNSWIGNPSHSLPFIGNIGQSLQFGGEGADKEETPKVEVGVYAQAEFLSGDAIGAAAENVEANKKSHAYYSRRELQAQPGPSICTEV